MTSLRFVNRAVLLPLAGVVAVLAGCGRRDSGGRIIASGHVEATEVRVSTEVGGRLVRLPVEEGDVVREGQVIAAIDTVEMALLVRSARAERDMAAAQLRLSEEGPRREDVAAARARVESATAELRSAEGDLERMETLVASGAAPAKSRDDARTRRDVTAAAQKATREELKRLEAGTRPEDIDTARARLHAAEARLLQAEKNLADATIESPAGGVITEKLVESGELIAPGTAVIVVTNLADAWLTAFIAETDLGRVRLGQEAEVSTDNGEKRNGRVTYIASRAEFTPRNVQTRDERVKLVYEIRITLDNRDGLFKPGMPAEAILLPGAPPVASGAGEPR